jgi:hypothetical protein
MVDFVSSVTGGPLPYTGKAMKAAHKNMHITNAEFDAAAADLKEAMLANGVKKADIDALLTLVETARKDIVDASAAAPGKEKKEPAPPAKLDSKKPAEVNPPDKNSVRSGAAAPGEAEQATVQGKVMSKGQPLPGGTITFVAQGQVGVSAKLQADGTYRTEKGLSPGVYAVTIVPPKQPGGAAVVIPQSYQSAQTTALRVQLQKGNNEMDFNLQ